MRIAAAGVILGISLLASFSCAQDMKSGEQSYAMQKIKKDLAYVNSDRLILFDKDGDQLSYDTISATELKKFSSLKDYVASMDLAGKRKAGRMPECKEPKTIPPPPQCVLCKNGRTLCSNAHFGMSDYLAPR
jgi:hypothetical protein